MNMLKRNAIISPTKSPIKHLPFCIFNDQREMDLFIKFLENKIDDFLKIENVTPQWDSLEQEEKFSYWAYEIFHDLVDHGWRM